MQSLAFGLWKVSGGEGRFTVGTGESEGDAAEEEAQDEDGDGVEVVMHRRGGVGAVFLVGLWGIGWEAVGTGVLVFEGKIWEIALGFIRRLR